MKFERSVFSEEYDDFEASCSLGPSTSGATRCLDQFVGGGGEKSGDRTFASQAHGFEVQPSNQSNGSELCDEENVFSITPQDESLLIMPHLRWANVNVDPPVLSQKCRRQLNKPRKHNKRRAELTPEELLRVRERDKERKRIFRQKRREKEANWIDGRKRRKSEQDAVLQAEYGSEHVASTSNGVPSSCVSGGWERHNGTPWGFETTIMESSYRTPQLEDYLKQIGEGSRRKTNPAQDGSILDQLPIDAEKILGDVGEKSVIVPDVGLLISQDADVSEPQQIVLSNPSVKMEESDDEIQILEDSEVREDAKRSKQGCVEDRVKTNLLQTEVIASNLKRNFFYQNASSGSCSQAPANSKKKNGSSEVRKRKSRNLLSPERLAYVRAVDAERKRTERYRLRLKRLAENEKDGKRSRFRSRVTITPVSDNKSSECDEDRERANLKRHLGNYQKKVEELLKEEERNSNEKMPLEVLRAQIVLHAKLVSYLVQRSDMRKVATMMNPDDAANSSSRLADLQKTNFHYEIAMSAANSTRMKLQREKYLISLRRNEEEKKRLKGSNKQDSKQRGRRISNLNDGAAELAAKRALEAARKRMLRAERRAMTVGQ